MAGSTPFPVPDFRGLTVAVVGDLVADRYVYARPTRPSREAPVMVLRQEGEALLPGGAANTARNVASLGARVRVLGCIGRDEAGRGLLRRLAEDGVGVAGVEAVDGWETPIKTRVLAGEPDRTLQQVLRLDREPAGPPPESARRRVAERLLAMADEVDALVVSDYSYGVCGAEVAEAVAAFRRASAVPIVLDPRRAMGLFRGVTAVTPNREELAAAAGLDPRALDDPALRAGAAARLLEDVGPEFLLVTLGKAGMALHGRGLGPEGLEVSASGSQDVVDVTGAGDTAAAAFALGLAAGVGGPLAMVLANAAAGVVVMKLGAEVCSPAELAGAVARLSLPADFPGLFATVPGTPAGTPGALLG